MKITIYAKPYGYTGNEIYAALRDRGIVAEFYDKDFICFMLNEQNTDAELEALKCALFSIPRKKEIKERAPTVSYMKMGCSPKEALMSEGECIDTEDACGRIFASLSVSCPPAIPIAVCGEILDEECILRMKYYGVQSVRVKK